MIVIDTCLSTLTVVDTGGTNDTLSAANISYDNTASGAAASTVQDAIDELQDKEYTHSQATAATTWTIPHNLGKYPAIQAFDSGLTRIEGVETHFDLNTVIIEFNTAVSGIATLN